MLPLPLFFSFDAFDVLLRPALHLFLLVEHCSMHRRRVHSLWGHPATRGRRTKGPQMQERKKESLPSSSKASWPLKETLVAFASCRLRRLCRRPTWMSMVRNSLSLRWAHLTLGRSAMALLLLRFPSL